MTKKICSFLLILFLFVSNALADNAYKNELTKIGFSQLGASDVKITLYMVKPYSEPLRLLKKNESEFVLILPETYSSAPQKPSISDVIGEITDVDVKLYSFASSSSENGYTKIVIRTNGFVNLYPESVTTGGGKLVNNEASKIVASQIKQNLYQPQTNIVRPTDNSYNYEPVKSNTAEDKPFFQNIQIPIKEKSNALKSKDISKENVSKNQTKNDEKAEKVNPLSVVFKKSTKDIKTEQKQVNSTPKEPEEPVIEENTVSEATEQSNEVLPAEEKITVLANEVSANSEEDYAKTSNNKTAVPYSLIAFLLLFIAYKLLSSKRTPETFVSDEKDEEDATDINEENSDKKGEYSDFFKTLIDSEIKGDNAFQLGEYSKVPQDDELIVKTHKEALDIDQNLSWQEKFRAIQRSKKSLLKDDEKNEEKQTVIEPIVPEIDVNMNIENPIKKLKQDFKAVKKVLEKQSRGKDFINQKISLENMEQVEVISFEDYQKQVEPPKVQINVTSPIKSAPPKILSQLALNDNRGLYLIDYNNSIALVGYIKDKVFKLSSYPYMNKTRLYARLSESVNGKDTYIVKFDDKKMLIDVSNDEMLLKLTY